MSLVSYGKQFYDTLANLVTGLGTQKDPRTSTHYVFRELMRHQIENAYRSDWLARRLVDLPAEDATREWRMWQADPKKVDAITALERKFEIQKKTRQAITRGRLYGGACLVLGVDVGNPDEELDYQAVGKDDLMFVVVLNRYELFAGPRIYNVESPWYTRPEYYQVGTPMFNFQGGQTGGATPESNELQGYAMPGMIRIHPSRVIEFIGNEMPDWRLIPMGGGWGDSILQTVDDSLRDFAMIVGGLAGLVNDMKMDVVKVPELTRKLSTKELTDKTLQRFGIANMAKSQYNTLLLDKDEEWDRIQTTFGSTPELIRVAMTLACGAAGIPESRVMGNAPSKGLAAKGSSGGEVDIRNYYDDIASKQKTIYKPALLPLDICLQRSALGTFDPKCDYEWNPLYQPNPLEVAQESFQKAQATQVYMSTGLINEDALREAVVSQLIEDGIYPGLEDAIEEFGAEPEEPEEPPQQLPPTPPPGMMGKGQFEANPFHMLRAQQAAKAGQPIRVPPNRPAGPPKFAPPQAKQDFNPFHDPHSGEFTSSEEGGEQLMLPGFEKQAAELNKAHPEMRAAHKAAVKEFFSSPEVRNHVEHAVGHELLKHAIGVGHMLVEHTAIDFIMEAVGGAVAGLGVAALTGSPWLAGMAGAVGKYAVKQIMHHVGLTPENAYHVVANTTSTLASHYYVIRSEMGSGMAGLSRYAESLDAVHDIPLMRDSVYLSLRALDRALQKIKPSELGDFDPDEPRNPHGEWTAGGVARAVGGGLRKALSAIGYGSEYGSEEEHILKEGMHKAGSAARKGLAAGVRSVAGDVPKFLAAHLKEEKHHVVAAAAGLNALAHGRKLDPEHIQGLKAMGMKALWAGAYTAMGPAAHAGVGLGALAGAFGTELAKHAAFDYAIKMGVGGARAIGRGGAWRKPGYTMSKHDAEPDSPDLTDEDHARIKEFLERLADRTENHEFSDEEAAELLRRYRETAY